MINSNEIENKNNEKIEQLLSELKFLEDENRQLKANVDSQKDLLSITAHELRTPLQTILGYTEMIMEEAHYRDFDLQNGGYVSLIQKNAYRLQSLIEKIMDIAKIGSRSLVPNRVFVEINQEIEDIVDEYHSALLNTADTNNRLSKETIVDKNTSLSNSVPQSFTIKFIPSKETLMVNIDRLKIYQVITNLLNNPLKSVTKKYDQLLSNDIKQNENIIIVSVIMSSSKVIPYYPEKINDMTENDVGTIIFDKSSITTKNSNPDTDRRTEERSKIKRYAIINVEDSGQGIDNGIIPTLFTKYGSLSTHGMGFGLYLVKKS